LNFTDGEVCLDGMVRGGEEEIDGGGEKCGSDGKSGGYGSMYSQSLARG
jgi:hypothetical protein